MVQVGARIPQSLVTRIDAFRDAQGLTRQDAIRLLLMAALDLAEAPSSKHLAKLTTSSAENGNSPR